MGQAVYLAGKIGKNDWRHEVVERLRDRSAYECSSHGEVSLVWFPRWPDALFGRFDYVGPFFLSCDHGGFHGEDSHGNGANREVLCCSTSGPSRRTVAEACIEAITDADVFFAWLDDPTAHGTLIEIGYALASKEARGKPGRVVVARPPPATDDASFEEWLRHGGTVDPRDEEHGCNCGHCGGVRAAPHDDYDAWLRRDDLWFASALPGVEHVRGTDPVSVLRAVLCPAPRVACGSPAEEKFWAAWQAAKGPRLQAQHKVLGGKYRLDFAHLASKTAIEVDGLAYHDGQESFQRDHARRRELTQLGWRVIRFTAKEVLADARRCAREAVALCTAGGVVEVRRPARLDGSNGSNSGSNGSNSGSNGSNSGSNG